MIGGLAARHTLTRLRVPAVDDGRGNVQPDWTAAPEETALPGWAVDAGSTVEDLVNRDGAEVSFTVRGPADADVRSTDRIRFAGVDYEIDGGVRRQPGASAATSHMILLLTRWEG